MTSQLLRIFRWQTLRHALRHRTLALLNVCSVALGVAVYLAIQIANQSANRSFEATVDLVGGKAHLEARGRLPDAALGALKRHPGVRAATPLVEGIATVPKFPGEYLHILGIDVFSNLPFRTFEVGGGGASEGARGKKTRPPAEGSGTPGLEPWLASRNGVAIPRTLAKRLGVAPGSRLRVRVNGELRELNVLSFLKLDDASSGGNDRFAAMDIGWAQELFGMEGELSAVQMILDDPAHAERIAEELRRSVPPDATVEPPRQRSAQLEKMAGAFQLNLSALSLVSLLVGMFLIYNTTLASVARHRHEIGILRSLGASRREVRFLFLGEAGLFGVAGVVLGIAGGVALSQGLIGAVSKTISSLYVLTSIRQIAVDPAQVAVAALLGIGSVILAAWIPATQAANQDPLQALSAAPPLLEPQRPATRLLWAGAAALLVAAALSGVALRIGVGWLGLVSAFFVMVGFACLAPACTAAMAGGVLRGTALAAGGGSGFVLLRLGAQGIARALHRNAVTVAALSAAIGMVVAVSVMIFSFRESLDRWIARTIVADLFVATASNQAVGLDAAMPPEAAGFLKTLPGVRSVDTFREVPAKVIGPDGKPIVGASLAVTEGPDRGNLQFESGGWADFGRGEAVLVTESFSRKFGKRVGAPLTLATPNGPQTFRVAGVYRDYSRDGGMIRIDRALFDRFWHDPRVNSLAVYLEPGVAPASIEKAFRQRFGKERAFAIYANEALRKRILSVFDQTFAVTSVLRVISIVVAGLGIFLTMTTAVTERVREIGIFRSVGASARQVRWLFLTESGLIGVAASGLGIACGCCLSVVLTGVVNRVFFGWTIDLRFPWGMLAATPLWIVPAALLAAWVPAWRAARQSVAEAIRNE